MRITGIGSRETPEKILIEMIAIGQYVAGQNFIGRSGHSAGADFAFESGCQKSCEVYLPWADFNSQLPMLGKPIVVSQSEELDAMVRKYHPAPDRLTRGAFSLMRRNSCQVLGPDLDKPSDAICYYSVKPGGTDQAIRIASNHGIPCFNLAFAEFATAVLVIAKLEEIAAKSKIPEKV